MNTALLKALINALPDLFWLKDPEGVYLACNKRFEAVVGHPESAIVGHTDYDFVPNELADFFRVHDLKAMAAGHPTVNEEWVSFASDASLENCWKPSRPMCMTVRATCWRAGRGARHHPASSGRKRAQGTAGTPAKACSPCAGLYLPVPPSQRRHSALSPTPVAAWRRFAACTPQMPPTAATLPPGSFTRRPCRVFDSPLPSRLERSHCFCQ